MRLQEEEVEAPAAAPWPTTYPEIPRRYVMIKFQIDVYHRPVRFGGTSLVWAPGVRQKRHEQRHFHATDTLKIRSQCSSLVAVDG